MIKKLLKKVSDIASSINGKGEAGNDTQPIYRNRPEYAGQPNDPQPAKSVSDEGSILDNAIDNRDMAVRKIVDSFRTAIGTNSRDFETLVVHVVYSEKPYDPLLHAWADDDFIESLRRALDNALLSAIGSDRITLNTVHIDDLDRQQLKEIVPDTLYVAWQSARKATEAKAVGHGRISLVEGTGSLAQPFYDLSTEAKTKYCIGRGAVSRKDGRLRQNDIVINPEDPDPQINQSNMCVSSAHADIVVRPGRFYLKAADGGCRSKGGAPTKLIRGESVIELSDTSAMLPLQSGDIIELGKNVCLLFTYL